MPMKPSPEEERYFRAQEQRRAEEREEQRQLLERDAERKTHLMRCPKCGGHLEVVQHQAVELDRCPDCHGIWLDAGELQQLTDRDRGFSLFGFLTRG